MFRRDDREVREVRKVPSFQYYWCKSLKMSVLHIDHNLAKEFADCLESCENEDIRAFVNDLLRDESGWSNAGKSQTHYCDWAGRMAVFHFAGPFILKVHALAVKSNSDALQNEAIQALLDKIEKFTPVAKAA